jgi:predicted dehydrogenase
MEPVAIGIIGMGGFAGAHHDAVLRLESRGEFRLVCTCDPHIETFGQRRHALGFDARGVRCFTDYRQMLDACADSLEMVTIPTPLPLHAPMHRACVERGIPAYLEKPPTLVWSELEAMLEVESRARRQTAVGFNNIIEPERQALKRRLVQGEFGPVASVSVFALWPRLVAYFKRNDWAGRLRNNGTLILDSCIGNAMAHQVHNALFWSGTGDFWEWGGIESVRAELYRVHEIDGLDTAFITAATDRGVALRVGMSHACSGNSLQEERIECERAVIRYHLDHSGPDGRLYSVTWNDGRVEIGKSGGGDLLEMNLTAYGAYLRGKAERPVTRLVDCRPFVHFNNLTYIAAGKIVTIPPCFLGDAADGYIAVLALPEIMDEFYRNGLFPSEQGVTWAVQGGTAVPADLATLEGVIETMCSDMALAQVSDLG